jgi:NTE family protein
VASESAAPAEPPVVPRSEATSFDPGDPSVVTTATEGGPREGVALCLSGGGSRAMLYHAGAVLRLAQVGVLGKLNCVSSVSGGSITAGMLASCWVRNGGAPSPAVVREQLIPPLLDLSSRFIDIPAFILGTLLPGSSPGARLAGALDEHLFHGFKLGDLPGTPDFVINATNLGTGVLWRFSKDFVGDYQIGGGPRPELPLATAVGASSAFPPVFTPFTLRFGSGAAWPGRSKLRVADAKAFRRKVDLGDGGIYDNLGLETAWKRFTRVFVSDGGGTYRLESKLPTDVIRLAIRVTETIDHQVRSLRLRQIVEGYKHEQAGAPGGRTGALWAIRTPYGDYPKRAEGIVAPPERTAELAGVGTHMRGLKPDVARRIVNWGYAISDAAMRSYVPDVDLDDPELPFPAEGI